MRLRIASMDEHSFLICMKHGVYGSSRNIFKKWEVGDKLLFIVDKKVAGIADVLGQYFPSIEEIWANDIFPDRIPIQFIHAIEAGTRPPITDYVSPALREIWGENFAIGILGKWAIEGDSAESLLAETKKYPDNLKQMKTRMESLINKCATVHTKKA